MVTINEILPVLLNGTTFIIGNEKNAGKTTFLNYILNFVRELVPPAYLSIGIDGEKKDEVFGNLKPRVVAKTDDFVITTETCINASNFEICDVYPFKNVFGRIVLAKCLKDSFVELIGPETNSQIKFILNDLYSKNIKTVFIDGAVNRLTQINVSDAANFIPVFNINPKNLLNSIDKITLLAWGQELETFQKVTIDNTTYITDGAFTLTKLQSIDFNNINTIVVDDITKLFVSYKDLSKYFNKVKFYLKNQQNLVFFNIILRDIKKDFFENQLGSIIHKYRFIYNPLQYY